MTILHGDCLEVLATLPENSVDTCITDPPYELGFMGKKWDNTGVAFQPETWAAVYRVLKPGAILLAFGGTRTYHRLACAIEDAGFEIRDTIAWVYGSGFPKSYDISKGIDKQAGVERETEWYDRYHDGRTRQNLGTEHMQCNAFAPIANGNVKSLPSTPEAQLWHGWGTALKPAHEPIVVAMKPVDGTFVNNALTWGVAGLNIDGGRVGYESDADYDTSSNKCKKINTDTGNKVFAGMSNKTALDRVEKWKKDSLKGRFPANFIHDGSDEVTSGFPMTSGGSYSAPKARKRNNGLGLGTEDERYGSSEAPDNYGDSGSAARFFYCAKASRSERNAGLEGMVERESRPLGISNWEGQTNGSGKVMGKSSPSQNHHPTVKPLALMRYLCKLTKTPTGGIVLDPFMGSGTTGIACVLEGREFIGIEREPEYVEIAEKRIAHYERQAVQLPLETYA